jgi:hypothetical protein
LLHTKIRLFELVVGELDLILDQSGDDGGEGLETLLGEAWLKAESDEQFGRELDRIGEDLVAKRDRAVGQEQLATVIASEDAAGRLEREFTALSIPARVRLGYGTIHLHLPRGVETQRASLGIHVADILEILGQGPHTDPIGHHPDYGPLYRITGITGTGRVVQLQVQADRLPMTLVDISGDPPPAA